ncbi:rod-binding protein [Limnoglobus roseus]|uniref:rod-binding protein n=1 Tax=Limnoglobus roseus TaxID=2598579 RepID=UPI0036F1E6BE
MRQTLEPEGGLFPGDAGDVQGGMFDLFLSQHLADAGGIGLATVIEQQLRPVTHASDVRPQLPTTDRAAPRPPSPGRTPAANQ